MLIICIPYNANYYFQYETLERLWDMEFNGRPRLILGLITYLLYDLGNLLSLCLIFLISRMGLT